MNKVEKIMTVRIYGIERALKDLIYNKFEAIEKGSLVFNVEIFRNEFKKLDETFIYMGEEENNTVPLYGKFNCRVIQKKNEGEFLITNARYDLHVDYDIVNSQLLLETLDCSLER